MNELRRFLTESAGSDDSTGLGGDILDVPFRDLGYDSLALLATAARVKMELGIALPEEEVATVETPKEFLAMINERA